jgi:hypothetical protein
MPKQIRLHANSRVCSLHTLMIPRSGTRRKRRSPSRSRHRIADHPPNNHVKTLPVGPSRPESNENAWWKGKDPTKESVDEKTESVFTIAKRNQKIEARDDKGRMFALACVCANPPLPPTAHHTYIHTTYVRTYVPAYYNTQCSVRCMTAYLVLQNNACNVCTYD